MSKKASIRLPRRSLASFVCLLQPRLACHTVGCYLWPLLCIYCGWIALYVPTLALTRRRVRPSEGRTGEEKKPTRPVVRSATPSPKMPAARAELDNSFARRRAVVHRRAAHSGHGHDVSAAGTQPCGMACRWLPPRATCSCGHCVTSVHQSATSITDRRWYETCSEGRILQRGIRPW